MALAEMRKARIAVHKSVADELAASLQKLGCCEFVDQDKPETGNAELHVRTRLRRVEELLADARFLVRLLEPFEKNKESSIARMLGDVPTLSYGELESKVDEKKFPHFVEAVREKEKKITESRAEISRYRGLLVQSEQLSAIAYPLELFTSGTDEIGGAVYSVPKPASGQVQRLLSDALGEYFEVQELPSGEKDAAVIFAVLYRKAEHEKVVGLFSELSAGRIDVPKDFALTAAEEKERITAQIEALEKTETEATAALSEHADEGLEMARYYGDFWSIQKDRLESMLSGLPTEDVLIWTFWSPKNCMPQVKATVERYDALTDFEEIEPEENELPPTLLKNPKWSSCMEPLTLMYGTPTYGGVDPTSLMAPFFFLFLGMCFGDAGYGLILSGLFGYFLVRHQLSPSLRKYFVMLTVGMLCSVAFGALTGSFFGDSIDAFPFLSKLIPLKDKLQMLDPMNDPMTLLSISLGLGFIQVMFGLMIAFRENWTQGEKFAALADQGGWIVFLSGLLLFGLSKGGMIGGVVGSLSMYIAIAGAVILIATQGRQKTNLFGKLFSGVLSLYNVTGYLGDVLSYSRLLALGLGSAAVGMVINLLATLVTGIPYVGVVLAVLIFVLGHLFSIAVNLLGAFIHSLRLQYVEFFGKFYNANGRDFAPLQNRTYFARLREDGAVK